MKRKNQTDPLTHKNPIARWFLALGYDAGLKEAFEESREEGRKEGEKEGEKEARLQILRELAPHWMSTEQYAALMQLEDLDQRWEALLSYLEAARSTSNATG